MRGERGGGALDGSFLRVLLGVWFHRLRTEAQLRRCGIPHLSPFETFHLL